MVNTPPLIVPSIDTTAPTTMIVAPIGPSVARAASASGRVDVASEGTASTLTTWIATYSSATTASPTTMANGVSRCGSRNSPAATSALSQPTNENASKSTPFEKL